jgi:Zn-dependent protease
VEQTSPSNISPAGPPPAGLPPSDPPPSASPPPSRRGLWATIGVGLTLALAKLKLLLIPLKALKFGKLLVTAGSMFLMIGFEAMRSGWAFGVGFVLLILIHELGHAQAIRRAGLAAGYPVFIPFFGAMIALRGQPQTPLVEARIALAGPLAGAAASVATAAIYFANHQRLYLALAYSGFFLNLFNLIPVSPLDGGRVAQLFSRRAWIVGIVLLGGMFLLTQTPQLLLIGIMAATQIFRRPPEAVALAAAEVPAADRMNMAASYFGLAAFLATAAFLAHRLLAAGA